MALYFKRAGVAALLIFCSSIGSYAQQDSIDVFIKAEMQKRHIPGLQLAIVKGGKIIKASNYGLANVQDSIPVSNQTVFPINSITKAFTGVAIMPLVESGKVSLTAPVSTYLPDLPLNWQAATVQQLLSHTSGIPDIVNEEEAVMIADSEEASWKAVLALPMDFSPGESFRYNQTNYLLLGRIIDQQSGMPFTKFIQQQQLAKAGMSKTINAGFGGSKDVIAHAAAGYRYTKGKWQNLFFAFPPSLQTAAGMSSTATEMAAWIIALQNLQLLKEKTSLQALWSPAKLNNGKTGGFSQLLNGYAAGWPTINRKKHAALAPVGGGRSALFVYPDDDLSIIVLTNLAGGAPDAYIDEIAGFYFPDMKERAGFGLSEALLQVRSELEISGYSKAPEVVKKLQKKSKDFQLSEREINSWGYKLLQQNKGADALHIFKLNVLLHPQSANAFDSLGEVYAAQNNTADAIKNYEQSLKLNPENTNAIVQLQKLKAQKN